MAVDTTMAANDHYNDNNYNYNYGNNQSSQPQRPLYTAGHHAPPIPSLPQSGQQYYHQESSHFSSPFETSFDDHVYPAPHLPLHSQHSFGQDSGYSAYSGQAGRGEPQESTTSFGDNIPLQPQQANRNKDKITDHVYDAREAGMPDGLNEDKRKRRRGMGIFQRSKKRMAWVTYLLTTIQLTVFIVEIVKNGKCGRRSVSFTY